MKPQFLVAREFGTGEWLNSAPLTLVGLRGQVVLLDFWDFTCLTCLRSLPYVKEWGKRYADKGLVVIGVHTPEFSFARNADLVRRAAMAEGLTYPLVLDNAYDTWEAYENQDWPSRYLIDREGYVRHRVLGEGQYQETEGAIQVVLEEGDPGVELPGLLAPVRTEDTPGAVCYRTTPAMYAGTERGQLGNPEGFSGLPRDYRVPPIRKEEGLYVDGVWRATPEASECSTGGYALVRYHAAELYAVLAPAPPRTSVQVTVTQDGAPLAHENAGRDVQISAQGISYVVVDSPRLYEVVHNSQFGAFECKLDSPFGGLVIYSIAFTTCIVPPDVLAQLEAQEKERRTST